MILLPSPYKYWVHTDMSCHAESCMYIIYTLHLFTVCVGMEHVLMRSKDKQQQLLLCSHHAGSRN